MKSALSIFFIAFISYSGLAQKDLEGSKDHPLISRYPGSYIDYYETVKFLEYDLATGPVTGYRYIEQREIIPGQVTRITYLLKEPVDKVSITEVYRDYLEAMQQAGLSILAKGLFPERNVKGTVGGGTWIGIALKPQPFSQGGSPNYLFSGTSTSGGTFSVLGRLDRPEGSSYAAIYGERHSENLVVVHLDIIETKTAETGHIAVNADYLKREIEDKGSVVIYGIQFDFDSSTLKPGSTATLSEMAKYLKENPGISLYVVGHTDMKGSLAYNLNLSKNRSQSVVEALVRDYGIEKDRLIPDGVAFLAPKASNDTEEGRALNRRTELVRRNE
jgi:outer membrane protein OmpA-like peptidoglycan-associated protein